MPKKNHADPYEVALRELKKIPHLDERGRIELLIRTQDRLNNGDAMAFFGHWLDAVCEVLEIGTDGGDLMDNPFS